MARARSWTWPLLGAAAGVLAVVLLVGAGQTLFTALPGDNWFQQEAMFGFAGLVVLVTAIVA